MQHSSGSRILYVVIGASLLLMLGAAVTRPLLPLFIVKVGATSVQLGFIMALPRIVSAFTRVPVSALSHRIGRWRLILFALGLSALSTTLYAFIHDPLWFFPVVSLAAVSWPVISPIAITIVSNRSEPDDRGATLGLYYTSIAAALFIGPLIGSFVTLFLDLRRLFLVSAAFPLIAFGIFALTIKPRILDADMERDDSETTTENGSLGITSMIFKNRNVLALCYARIAVSISMAVFSILFPIHAEAELELTPSLISLLFSIRGVSNTLVRTPSGRLSDVIGRRKPFIIAYSTLIAVFFILTQVSSISLLIIGMILYGVGWGMRIAPSTALLTESVPPNSRSIALAVFMTMWDIGFTIGALIAGFGMDYFSYQTILMACIFILLSALIVFTIISKEKST
jgi:MFS family permease